MLENDNSGQSLSRKAYEIAYALFRIASFSKKRSYTEHLERQALSFLVSAVREDYPIAQEASNAIEYLLRLGEDVGIVNAANSQTIIGEIVIFNSAIAGLGNAAKPQEIDLSNVFSRIPVPSDKDFSDADFKEVEIKDTPLSSNHSSFNAAMRQSAILEKIRQNENCRLKDMQEALPDASERTIRYDLQNLVAQGLIERVGNGGPATFYRSR